MTEASDQLLTLVHDLIREVADETGSIITDQLASDTPVFESGLDSLGFAILVAKLEDRLGFDPFVSLKDPVYPRTIGEFIDIYVAHQNRAR